MTGPKAGPVTGRETRTETGPEAGAMTGPETGTETGPETATETRTEAGPVTGLVARSGSRRRKLAAAVTGAVAGGAAVTLAAVVALGGLSSSHASGRDGGPARLAVSGAYIPRPPLSDLAAAYFTVTNSGGTAAELTSVTTPLAARVTLHTTTGATMRQTASLPVPPGGRLALGTGGDHLMLEDLTHRPATGETVRLTLHFAHVTPDTMTVTVPVRPTTYRPGD